MYVGKPQATILPQFAWFGSSHDQVLAFGSKRNVKRMSSWIMGRCFCFRASLSQSVQLECVHMQWRGGSLELPERSSRLLLPKQTPILFVTIPGSRVSHSGIVLPWMLWQILVPLDAFGCSDKQPTHGLSSVTQLKFPNVSRHVSGPKSVDVRQVKLQTGGAVPYPVLRSRVPHSSTVTWQGLVVGPRIGQ